jgi:filamin
LNAVDSRLPTARGEGLHHGVEDKLAIFYVDAQNMQGSLDVKIEGPQHFTKYTVDRQSDGLHIVKYTPVEVGLFKIYVKWNNRDIPGSPFVSYVVNPDRIRVVGGWQSVLDSNNILNLKLEEEKMISFDTSEAGPGTLNAVIISPNGNKLPLRLLNQGSLYTLTFTPVYEGEYKIQLTWDAHALPNTPLIAKCDQMSDPSKIQVKGVGIKEAKINQEAEFIIDGSRAGNLFGFPEIKLAGTKTDIDVKMQQISHNVFRCTYTPYIPGAYLLNIKWNDRQIIGSPFKVNVTMNSDPSKVVVSGEGIRVGVLGDEIKATIDTRGAGPGELTANCMGPQKVAFCEFFDHKDGTFTLYVKPQEPGKHILQIKYNGEHVPGSPFVVRVSGPPDASKVKVTGPGIYDGVLSNFKSRFVCDTKGAGAGQLTVRIRGPKGKY